jgi:hypothetical protein
MALGASTPLLIGGHIVEIESYAGPTRCHVNEIIYAKRKGKYSRTDFGSISFCSRLFHHTKGQNYEDRSNNQAEEKGFRETGIEITVLAGTDSLVDAVGTSKILPQLRRVSARATFRTCDECACSPSEC